VTGYQLAFIEKEYEAAYAVWRHRPACYWSMHREDAASGDAVESVCLALNQRGCDIYNDVSASGPENMAVDVPKAKLAVICLTRGYIADCSRRGKCRQELEYVVQNLGTQGCVVLVLDQGLSVSALGLVASPLARSPTFDLSRGGDDTSLKMLAAKLNDAMASSNSPPNSRGGTASSQR